MTHLFFLNIPPLIRTFTRENPAFTPKTPDLEQMLENHRKMIQIRVKNFHDFNAIFLVSHLYTPGIVRNTVNLFYRCE